MPRADFYLIDKPRFRDEPMLLVCELARRAVARQQPTLILVGSQDEAERPSEHAKANALDVAAVTLKDGRTVSVLNDWRGDGPTGEPGGRFLHALRDGACQLFSTVLTPDYNAAHANHLHIDGAARGLCR